MGYRALIKKFTSKTSAQLLMRQLLLFMAISQILCKHHIRCKTEQNIFEAGAAEAAAALSTK